MEGIAAMLDIFVLAAILAVAMLAAWYVGKRMGRRLLQRGGATPSKFDDASMALLGLLLAFTFGTSIAKHDQRQLAVVADSNAIGNFYTCASLINDPVRTRLQTAIQEYAQLRLDLTRGEFRSSDLESGLAKFDQLHTRMTDLVAQAASDGAPIAALLTAALNEVKSNQALRLAAYEDRLPSSILILLFASAIITALLAGREQGVAHSSDIAGTVCFILLVSFIVCVTLDLNRPERGLIRVSQEPIERLLSSMRK